MAVAAGSIILSRWRPDGAADPLGKGHDMDLFNGVNVLNQLFIWVSILIFLGCAAVALAYVRLSAWLWLVAGAFAGITVVGVVAQLAVVFVTHVQGVDFKLFGIVLASVSILRVLLGFALVIGLGLTLADIDRRVFGPSKGRGEDWR